MKLTSDQFKAKMEDLRFRTQVILDEFDEIKNMYLEEDGDDDDDSCIFDAEAALSDAVYYLQWMRDYYEE